jgi:hypothetical protein
MRALALACAVAVAVGCAAPDIPSELREFVAWGGNPIFGPEGAGTWDRHLQERGFILHEEGLWKLWYTAHAEDHDGCVGDNRCKLGYALSPDGIRWTRWSPNPIYDEHHIEDAMVWHEGDTYYLYSEGADDFARSMHSPDGLQWQWEGTLDIRYSDGTPLTPGPFGTPTIWHEDGDWYLFYERLDDGVWLARSSDRRTWINVQDDPVLLTGPSYWDSIEIEVLQVLKYQGRYFAYYDGRGTEPVWSSGVAVSSDLIHWEKYPDPLFPPPENKTTPIVVPDGERCFRLYNMHPLVQLHFSRSCPAR